MPRCRKDRLWMELDTFNGKLFVADAHYLIVIDRLGGHFEAFRQALSFHDKRMISRSLEGAPYSTENAFSIVSDWASFAVAESPRSNDLATERVNNPLMSEANTQCRGFVAHFSEDSRARPEVSRVAGGPRAWGDYDPVRREFLYSCDIYLIITLHNNLVCDL